MNQGCRTDLAVVVIGRNEGERLRLSLQSVVNRAGVVVYVDSGSTDGSVAMARGMGVEVVELDMSIPFTAARARNAGTERALALKPDLRFVQFVDGDCEVIDGWLERAVDEFEARPDAAAVAGRLRERFPESSIYNRLCDMEWNTVAGEVGQCGGIAMMRVADLQAVGGFNPDIIAGEEPELCVRFRASGRKIIRLADDMAWHDAAMFRFKQWWKRAYRSGHAYAEGADRHPEEPSNTRQVRSNIVGGLVIPAAALLLALPTLGLSLVALLGLYALWMFRVARYRRRTHHDTWKHAAVYGFFCMIAKVPMALGQMRYWRGRRAGRRSEIIEYKTPAAASAGDQRQGSHAK